MMKRIPGAMIFLISVLTAGSFAQQNEKSLSLEDCITEAIKSNLGIAVEILNPEIADTYGMVCFSTDWQEPIMWGHYADFNRGIVLGFESVSNRFDIKEVKYPPERKKMSLDPQSVTPSEYIDAVGFIKYKGWSYEKEHRFFVKLDDCRCIEENYFLAFANDLRLREVIIGPAHPCKNRKNYTKTARYIVDLVKQNGAKLIVSRPEFGGYRIVRCGLWTPRFVST